jgi:Fe-S-cluster-containing dehydrogenase component|tara:strand:- start:221 stop:970 length:750 start_codon:yes stop_codon:yes gene_type:complete
MTSLPQTKPNKKLGLVIDLDICVGCHACAVNCKEWNTSGHSAPLHDVEPYGDDPSGVWFNRIHTFEIETEVKGSKTVHFPKSCLHCDDAPCVTVCPTGASYKREEDGIVLVNADTCIGCKLCSWACPYGAREYDENAGVMKKCTLCVDKIYNENIPKEDRVPACVSSCPVGARSFGDLNDKNSDLFQIVSDRNGYNLMPELECSPTNKYLPPRKNRTNLNEIPLESITKSSSSNDINFEEWSEKINNEA